MEFEIRQIDSKAEMLDKYELLVQLSPWLKKEKLDTMLSEMISNGYKMIGIFTNDTCCGVSGYWISTKIYSGRFLEMDNVVIGEEYRSQGLGKLLSDYLIDLARKENCRVVMLDAYLENHRAHEFYEREGFVKKGYHFVKKLG